MSIPILTVSLLHSLLVLAGTSDFKKTRHILITFIRVYQVFRLDDSVDNFSVEAVVFIVLDVEHQAAVLGLVLRPDVFLVQVEHLVLNFSAQLKTKNYVNSADLNVGVIWGGSKLYSHNFLLDIFYKKIGYFQ